MHKPREHNADVGGYGANALRAMCHAPQGDARGLADFAMWLPPPPASQTTREHEPAPLNTENGGPPPKAMPKPMQAEIEAGLRARSKTEAGIVAYPNLTEPPPSMGRAAPTAESTPPWQRQGEIVGGVPSERGRKRAMLSRSRLLLRVTETNAMALRHTSRKSSSNEQKRRDVAWLSDALASHVARWQPSEQASMIYAHGALFAEAAKRGGGRRRGPDLRRGSAAATGHGGTDACRGDELTQCCTPGYASITAPRGGAK